MLHFICHTHNLTLAHPLQLFLQKLLLFSRFLEFFFPVCKCRFFCFDFCLAAGLSDKSPRSVHPSDLYSDGYIE